MCIFAGAWMVFAPHPWALWSILGSALILFTSYFQVQASVATFTGDRHRDEFQRLDHEP